MGVKKFMELVQETLGLDEMRKESKKKSVKNLLKKLNSKKDFIDKSLKEKIDTKRKKELLEEKDIIAFQIKKGNAILKKLTSEKKIAQNKLKKEKNGK